MKHLRILKYFNFFMAGISLFFGIGGLLVNLCSEQISIVGSPIFLMIAVMIASAHVVVGYLVSAQRGRAAQTVLAIFQLIHFPIGSVFSFYALWVCWFNKTTKMAFQAPIKPRIS